MWRRVAICVVLVVAAGFLSAVSASAATDPVLTITAPTTATTWISTSSPLTLSGTVVPGSGTISNVACWHAERARSCGTVDGTTSWSVSAMLVEGTNRLSVWAVASDGRIGGDSITITYAPQTVPPEPPAAPVLQSIVLRVSVEATWQDNADNEASQEFEQAVDGPTAWQNLASLSPNVTSLTITGLEFSRPYCWRVRASNSAGSSPYSNVVCRIVRPSGALEEP